MLRRLSYSLLLLALALLMIASACNHGSDNNAPNRNSGSTTNSTPENKSGKNRDSPSPVVSPDPTTDLGEVAFFGQGQVWLKVQGSNSFAPRLRGSFRSGDRLKIGEDSSATIMCPDRLCELKTGEFDSCCGTTCTQIAQMIRIGTGSNPPLVKISELPAAEARTLTESETKIRGLGLGQVTTQFLITSLYSNWKLEETNQQLDVLSNQLAKPGAKEELKDSYSVVTRQTGDMHRRFNRAEDAKKVYLLNLSSSSQTTDAKETAATHAGLAQAFKQTGDTNQAVQHFEAARDIYVKQGETKAAAATERQIVETKGMKRLGNTTLPKSAVKPQK